MGGHILLVDGATVAGHAVFLMGKMDPGIGLHKVHEVQEQLRLAPVGVGMIGKDLELINIINQHAMLRIYFRVSGLKFLVPLQHNGGRRVCPNEL